MTENPPNSLHELIHSLTPGERRNFIQLANYSRVSYKQYLTLFSILSKMKMYNEVKLQQKLEKSKVKTPLPVLSNYLQNLLLAALRFYHSGEGAEAKIMECLHNADILHAKGLSKLRDKSLSKAKTLATELEKPALLAEIVNKEWQYQSVFLAKDVQAFSFILTDLKKLLHFRELNYLQSILLSKGEIRDDELRQEWESLIANPLLSEETSRVSYEEVYHFHHIMMRYNFRINNFSECVKHQENLIQHMESREALLLNYKELYMFELNGLVVAYCQNMELEAANQTNNKLLNVQKWDLTTREVNVLQDIISISYSNLIHGCFIENAIQNALTYAEQAEVFLQRNKVSSFQKAFLYLNLAKACIYREKYHDALMWNNKILNAPTDNKRDDFFILSWIFNLVIHFELKHFGLLQYVTHSTYTFLKKRKKLYKTEHVILKYLKNKFPDAATHREMIALFKKMKVEMEEIKKDPYEAKAFKYFDYTLWLKSKIENTKLIDTL